VYEELFLRLDIASYVLDVSLDEIVLYKVDWTTLDTALQHNEAVLREHPQDQATRFALGNVLRMQGRLCDACAAYRVVAQSSSPWASSAAEWVAALDGQADRPPSVERTLRYVWSLTLWSPKRVWTRWWRVLRRQWVTPLFIPNATNLAEAIPWVLHQAGGVLGYRELVTQLHRLTRGTSIVWSQSAINAALYTLWRANVISSPGVRWLPNRPNSIDGLFDDPAWQQMRISVIAPSVTDGDERV
jgi:hypothetical protein